MPIGRDELRPYRVRNSGFTEARIRRLAQAGIEAEFISGSFCLPANSEIPGEIRRSMLKSVNGQLIVHLKRVLDPAHRLVRGRTAPKYFCRTGRKGLNY